MIELTQVQRQMARHALFGLEEGRLKRTFRNRYAVGKGDGPKKDAWNDLMAKDAATGWSEISSRTTFYHLTRLGAQSALKKGESLDPEDFPEDDHDA